MTNSFIWPFFTNQFPNSNHINVLFYGVYANIFISFSVTPSVSWKIILCCCMDIPIKILFFCDLFQWIQVFFWLFWWERKSTSVGGVPVSHDPYLLSPALTVTVWNILLRIPKWIIPWKVYDQNVSWFIQIHV